MRAGSCRRKPPWSSRRSRAGRRDDTHAAPASLRVRGGDDVRIERVRAIDGGAGATLVEVASDGATGIGLTQSAYEYIAPIIERGPYPLAPLLIGEEPREPRRLWSRMFQGFGAAKGRGSESGLAVNAMAALDMAIWDLAGKVQGLPLHTLLGGAVRDGIPAYASSSLFVSS